MEFPYLNYSLLHTRVKIFYCLHSIPKDIFLKIKGADWLDKGEISTLCLVGTEVAFL